MPEEDVQVVMFGRTVSLIDMADHDLIAWPVRPNAPSRTTPPPQRPLSETRIGPPFRKLPASLHATRTWALDRLFGEFDGLSSQ